MEPDETPDPGEDRGTSPDEGRPRREFVGALFALGAFLGGVVLLFVYVLIFFAAGPPRGTVGSVAFIPVGVYLLIAVLLTISRRWMSAGIGMLTGLGIWLAIGGGPCIGGLAGGGGLA
ncbi:hypothetical protein [Sinomonas flava]|uniref:Uncharacterized protein n=1 Tax=Sinomonas flava TaxID=496857 RepID=A0ABN3BS63_9MICC